MNEDHDWNHLEDTWKSDSPVSSGIASVVDRVKTDSRLAAWRKWLISLTVSSTIAVITSWCMLHRSVQSYTFTVIAWSAFFSFGSYLLATRQSASDLALDTTTALRKRSKTLTRGAQLLDFGRSLIGVETLICVGFWIALHHGERNQILPVVAAILFAGLVLYSGLSWILVRTRRELSGLESIAAALDHSE
jgi:hypothetical protein